MRNPFIETIEKLTGRKVIQEKMSCIHDGTASIDELVELALRTREALLGETKIGKPGEKLNFVHTGMLDADQKMKTGETKNMTIKEKKKLLKRLEREIANLERIRRED